MNTVSVPACTMGTEKPPRVQLGGFSRAMTAISFAAGIAYSPVRVQVIRRFGVMGKQSLAFGEGGAFSLFFRQKGAHEEKNENKRQEKDGKERIKPRQ